MARRVAGGGPRPDRTYLDRISPLGLTLYLPSALIIASSLESKAASPGQNGGENVGYHRNSTACDVKHVGEEWELGMRVLLIEDDSAIAQSIELMLKSEGFNVYTTDLGEEGIDLDAEVGDRSSEIKSPSSVSTPPTALSVSIA